MRYGIVVFGMAVMGMIGAEAAQAQVRTARLPHSYLDLEFMGANPVGEFGQLVGDGWGGQAAFRHRLAGSPLLLRIDGGFLVYGYERIGVCYATPYGCRIGADVTTTNTVGFMGVGPEIAGTGPVAPYVFGTFGFSYFSTQSSLDSGDPYYDDLFDTRHFSDMVMALRAGGGIRFHFGGPGSVALDLGAEYHRNGVAEYLVEGDIVDNPDGSITLYPNRSEANLMSFRVGITIPFGGGGDDRHGHHDGHDGRYR
ncbi:MAG TPA: hypothetical protein VK858_06475 [Longimicrobiales bacterium]|nr:hypothetical protein [Longimicrobiales bacterium]